MRRVPFRTILERIHELNGLTYDGANTSLLAVVVNSINRRVAEAWDWCPWPELLRVEQRAFAEDWVATESYSTGDVVWYNSAYWEAQQDSTGVAPVEGADWSETDTPADKLIAWEQSGETKIGRPLYIYKNDPRSASTNVRYSWMEDTDGIHMLGCTRETVWVVFMEPATVYSSIVWATNAPYERYDVVYYPGTETGIAFPDKGECYKAELDSAGEQFWQLQPFPAVLAAYVTYAAAADLARYYRKDEDAARLQADADDHLNQHAMRYAAQTRMNVQVNQ